MQLPFSATCQKEIDKIFSDSLAIVTTYKERAKVVVVDTETQLASDRLIGVGFFFPEFNTSAYLPIVSDFQKKVLNSLFSNWTKTAFIGHNIKFDLKVLYKETEGKILLENVHDTMILAWVLNSDRAVGLNGGLSLNGLCQYYNIQGKNNDRKSISDADHINLMDYCINDCIITYNLFKKLYRELVQIPELRKIYELERKIIPIVAKTELNGVCIDEEAFETFGRVVSEKVKEAQRTLVELTGGVEINFHSPKQVLQVLPKDILKQLPPGKTQPLTQQKFLSKFATKSPIVKALLDYRYYSTLRDTFYSGLKKYIINGKLYTSFNQAGSRTGRFSSSKPNLQNIPAEGELGDLIRRSFVASKGKVFIDVDFSQIELRCLAAVSKDKRLLEIYNSQFKDIHSETQELLGVSRRFAKNINFGIVYGQTPVGLADTLKISVKEAERLIKKFYAAYPRVLLLKQLVKTTVKERGWLKTLFGRRRYFVGRGKKESELLQAFNFLCQGTAQDIYKIALLYFCKASENLTPVLLVHDEFVFEVDETLAEFEAKRLKRAIEQSLIEDLKDFPVKLEIDIGIGKSWSEAKLSKKGGEDEKE